MAIIPDKLNPIIRSWINSDEFIDSLISIMREFNISDSALLSNPIIHLSLKALRPEAFQTTLLSSLPPEKQNEAIVTKLVHLSLLPIKNPLMASGIDISLIVPLDEANTAPYNPSAKPTEEQDAIIHTPPSENITNASALLSHDGNQAPSSINQEELITNSVPTTATPLTSDLIASTDPIPPSIEQSSPISGAPTPLSPNFNVTPSTLPATTPEPSPAPFIIHTEQSIPRVSTTAHVNELVRPIFYSSEQNIKEDAPIASVEFGKTASAQKIDPANIVDLNNLSL